MKVLINVLTKILSALFFKKKKRIVFGSWFGNKYGDNSKFMLEYIAKEFGDFELAWISKKDISDLLPKNCKFLKYNSFKAFCYIATSKIAFVSQGFADLSSFSLLGNCYVVQLWHGVAWKKIGIDSLKPTNNPFRRIARFFVWWYSKASLYIAPSVEYSTKLQKAFNAKQKDILLCGQPRNTYLFDKKHVDLCKKKICDYLNIEQDCFVLTYMPTFRDKNAKIKDISFIFDNPNVIKAFENNKVKLLLKGHYVDIQNKNSCVGNKAVFDANECDPEELLCASDILVTDYSSCFFDFLLLNRPIILFLYDYDYYANDDRGLYYPYKEMVVDYVAFSDDELINSIIRSLDRKINLEAHTSRINRFVSFESINNCKNVFQRVCKDNKIKI